MMKLPCEMVRDLLPLYHDGVCSVVSKELMEEHLKTCPDCANALTALKEELEVMPKLETDAAKPIKGIRRRWRIRTWLVGLFIGLAVFFGWTWLTQTSSVPLTAEDYEITNVVEFSNGMYYLEYRVLYDYNGMGADLLRAEDGSVYLQEYRPILARRDEEKGILRSELIDPKNHRTDIGTERPMTAFYLNLPDSEEEVLLWSAEEEYPKATAEMEREYLYQYIFR